MRRVWYTMSIAAVTVGLFAGCSSDDDASTCQSLQDFASDVRGLADVDLVAGGTDALDAQLDTIESSWDDVQASSRDQFGTQTEALDAALADLGSTLSSATEEGSSVDEIVDQAQADIDAVASAWNDLADAAETELGDCDLASVS